MTDTPNTPDKVLEEIETLRKRLSDLEVLAGLSSEKNEPPNDEGRARMYLDLAGVFMVVIEADQRISLINRKGCEILGRPEEEVIGRNWFDHFIPDRLRSHIRGVFEQLIAGELEPVKFFKNPIVDQQGNERVIAWHNTVLRDRSGRITGTLSSGTDVTDQERAEEKIRQLNRLLRTISDINQLIVREGDRKRLLEETCRIIVDRGGFRMAWVGEADYQTGLVRPLAQAGFDQVYLESVEVSLDDHPRGRGPVGGAISIGAPVVCQDTEEDETFIPWREAAREQGYRALAAFPLKLANRVMGSLNIYAGELGLFNEDMFRLLEELADDLSFALQALEEREARRSAEQALRDSEARFRDLYDQAPDMYLSVAAETGRVVDCNRTVCAVTGFSREEFIGRPVFDLYHPDCLDRVRKNLQQFLSTGEVQDEGLKILCRDGGTIEVSLKTSAVRDDAGRVRTSRSIWRDVSRQKEAERNLGNREAKIRSIFRAAPVGIGLVSYPDRVLVEVNDLMGRLVGYAPEELIGRSARMLYPSDEEFLKVRSQKYAQIENQGTGTVETRWRRKDGTVIDILLSSTPLDEQDYSQGVTFTALDITERLQSERALRASEENYRTHFENVSDVIYSLDCGLRMTAVSPSVERLSGYCPRELIGKTVLEMPILAPEFRAQALDDVQQVLAGHRIQSREYEFLAKDGSRKWAEVSGAPLMILGKVAGIVSVARDITERRRDKEALQALAQQWQTTFDAMAEAVCLLDDENRVQQCNRAMIRLVNKTPAEILGRRCWELMHGSGEPIEKCPAERMRQTGVRETLINREGDRWLEITADPIKDSSGNISGAVHIISDISEQKKTEAALRVREAHLSALIDSSTDAIISLDTQRVLTDVNPAFLKQFGCSREEAVGRSMTDFHLNREAFEAFGQRVYPAIKAKGHWMGEWDYRRKDGSRVPMETVISAIRHPGGEISGYVSIMRDMSERIKAASEKAALEQQLRQAQKLEAIGTLAGGIAHDFNNILGAVLGFTELARMDIPEGSPARFDLDQVLKASLRAKDLVRQILTFSRKGTETLGAVDILPAAKEALKLLRASLPTTIEIRQKVGVSQAVVHSDPTQIHQILMNLCMNAAQAMSDMGGLLEISLTETHLTADLLIEEPNATAGPYLEIGVKDSGPGISRDILDHIFEPYFTTKEKGLGTGLGLSVVHGIVKQHSGLVRVETELGQGAHFRVFLPLCSEKPVSVEKERSTLPRGSEHLLVVDDESVLVEILKNSLERLGYRVTALTDPQQALDRVTAQPEQFQLVLTDMTMPHLPGDRLVSKILEINPRIPVILVTGYSERLSDSRARELGARALLMKPIGVETLAYKVREVLDKD